MNDPPPSISPRNNLAKRGVNRNCRELSQAMIRTAFHASKQSVSGTVVVAAHEKEQNRPELSRTHTFGAGLHFCKGVI